MSVINKMLQDLEQRGAATEQPARLATHMPVSQQYWLRRVPWRLLVMLLVAAVLLLSWQLLLKKTVQPELVALQDEPVQQTELSIVQSEPQPLHHPAEITQENESLVQPEQVVAVLALQQASVPPVATVPATEPEQATSPKDVAPRSANPGQLSIARHTESAAAQQQRLLAEARQAQQNGQSAEAIRLLQQLQQQQPSVLSAYLQLARIYSQQQQWQTARQWLLQALNLGLEQPEVYFMLATIAAEQQDWLQALAHLPARFELTSHPDYYGLKAAVLQQLGRPADAYFWYRQLHLLQPTQARWSLGAAVVLEQQQQQRAARYYFQQALAQRQNLSVASVDYIQQRLAATDP
ncbi:tetratricopeptide repeat protein [Arsukibacterium sp.]|uniref:tetratricopeptide repeat protein n=1 Tax=Arsukibacterium sp. TaxID=1977258 RepID=UPI002FD8C37F